MYMISDDAFKYLKWIYTDYKYSDNSEEYDKLSELLCAVENILENSINLPPVYELFD